MLSPQEILIHLESDRQDVWPRSTTAQCDVRGVTAPMQQILKCYRIDAIDDM